MNPDVDDPHVEAKPAGSIRGEKPGSPFPNLASVREIARVSTGSLGAHLEAPLLVDEEPTVGIGEDDLQLDRPGGLLAESELRLHDQCVLDARMLDLEVRHPYGDRGTLLDRLRAFEQGLVERGLALAPVDRKSEKRGDKPSDDEQVEKRPDLALGLARLAAVVTYRKRTDQRQAENKET